MSIFSDTLCQALDDAGIQYETSQINECETYFRLVEKANKHMNLTRITDDADAAIRHFAEAVMLLRDTDLPQGCRVIDIGTGAGFPGMPLKLMRPDINITLLDASGKKTKFVRDAALSMGIDVHVLCARAEDAAETDFRESYDAAVSRAVAPLNILTELCVPFVKVGGIFAAWKGESYEQELSNSSHAFLELGCVIKSRRPVGRGALIITAKQKPTPIMYPRRFAKIKAQPL